MALPLLLLLGLLSHARAETIYVETKEYGWEWGEPPAALTFGRDGIRGWLEGKSCPELIAAPEGIRKAVIKHFELGKKTAVSAAITGPPRSTHGHEPIFYAWVEWVAKSKSIFDQDHRRYERVSGVAQFEVTGFGEKQLELRFFWPEEDLREAELQTVLPWDAAVVTKKIIELHAFRPRLRHDQANSPGRRATAY